MIYVDEKYHCHADNDSGIYRGFGVPFFYDKCTTFIEGHIYIPPKESMIDKNGFVLNGEMITPWKPDTELAAAQAQYELDMAEAAAAYQEGVNSAYDQ